MTKEQELQKALQAAQDALTAYQSVKPAVWVPKDGGEYYWRVIGEGEVVTCPRVSEFDERNIKRGTCYQTQALALKAAEYSKVQGLINQACLNVEPDYVPDWSDKSQLKWFVYYSHYTCRWVSNVTITEEAAIIYQSTSSKSLQVCDILNDINLKPVGVK